MLKTKLPKVITETLPGPKAQAIIDRRDKAMPAAVRCTYPLVIERGEGAMFQDVDGNIFLDWVGGVGVLNIGYSHPEIIKAVKAQTDKFFHAMMNIITHEPYIQLAEKLNEIVPVKGNVRRTMLVNTGAEANENAVKIAKAFTKRPNIIVFSGAFHGRTMLTMTMTAKKAYAYGMGPFPDGIYRAEFPYLYRGPKGYSESELIDYYIDKLKQVFIESSPADHVAAIVVEPVQGEGGFVPAPLEWIKAVRKICDEHGILLIADEVQTGFGRSGRLFASNYWQEVDCAPDIITSAKSLAAGLPLAAVVARTEIFDAVPVGTIGGTYSGNAVACTSALKVIELIQRDSLIARAQSISKKCMDTFNRWKDEFEVVGDVRGLGIMIGIEFVKNKDSKEPNAVLVNQIITECLNHGLLLENAGTYGNVIRFLCPIVVTDDQLQAGFDIFENAIRKLS